MKKLLLFLFVLICLFFNNSRAQEFIHEDHNEDLENEIANAMESLDQAKEGNGNGKNHKKKSDFFPFYFFKLFKLL